MSQGRNRLYFGASFSISLLPALVGVYFISHDRTALSILLFIVSVLCMVLSTVIFLGYKTVKHGLPLVTSFLNAINEILKPISQVISHTKIIGPIVSAFIRCNFFVWFILLLMSDHMIRMVLRRFVGQHPTKRDFSVINAMDPKFNLFDESIPPTKHLQNSDLFKMRKKMAADSLGGDKSWINMLQRPRYSRSLAYTLSVASKLVYEDIAVIKHELTKTGFDVANTFKPIAYLNICAFIVEKDNDILLVFRGTNPMNIQNYMTNINMKMGAINGPWGPMGKVHKGFWNAMGDPAPRKSTSMNQSATEVPSSTLHIELTNVSIYRTIASTVKAIGSIIRFLTLNIFHHVTDPVDTSWIGSHIDIRSKSMYAQAEKHIMDLIEARERRPSRFSGVDSGDASIRPKSRLFITGHSLGGALGTIFLAKMVQSKSPLLEHFGGLYTYGHPKIGDADFARVFGPHMYSKIFHHAYNNDIVTRVPSWLEYDTPPGTLVFIDSAYHINLYPPNPRTNEPVPIRPISYLHLSGLLNHHVIRRMIHENSIRILFRIIFPFFLNDHFPSDYCDALRRGSVSWVIMGTAGLQGGDLEEEGVAEDATDEYREVMRNAAWRQRRCSVVDVHDDDDDDDNSHPATYRAIQSVNPFPLNALCGEK